jgi:hypothetical protein
VVLLLLLTFRSCWYYCFISGVLCLEWVTVWISNVARWLRKNVCSQCTQYWCVSPTLILTCCLSIFICLNDTRSCHGRDWRTVCW